jgi:uncharacterized protein YjbJ (UPF0337 family)
MGEGKTDEAKGRIKQAGGDLTGDKRMKREGRADQATGRAKEKLDNASEKVKEAIGKS